MRREQQAKARRAFREWTHGLTFTLTMGKTQVAALISVHASANHTGFVGAEHKLHRRFVGGVNGLVERGLVIHHDGPRTPSTTIGEIFEVTEAGHCVVALLRVAGVYEELLAEFRTSDRLRLRRAG